MVALPFALWLLPFRLDLAAVAFGFAGGAVGGVGLILFYRAMAMNLIGVVAPVSAVVAAELFIFSALAWCVRHRLVRRGERPPVSAPAWR